jgi:predicted Zn finger-like uncharacterized protein
MLVTRCPQCTTTFRVTEDALKKAGGQVRCGRCAGVFNAYAELRETTAPAADALSKAAALPAEAEPAPTPQGPPPTPEPHTVPTAAAPPIPPAEPQRASPPPARSADSYDDLSVAAIVAQIELGADDSADDEPDGERSAVGSEPHDDGERVQRMLASTSGAGSTTFVWPSEEPPQRSTSSRWKIGAAIALVMLVLQNVHHFRADLSGVSLIGPIVQSAYGILGVPVTPEWDVDQYQILDWIAAAEPNARGQGTLQINARIHNRGPRAQPYPHIHLALKDRWEETVGSRVFRPAEYLVAGAATNAPMPAGDTVQARLNVVDPGPDAYGFELDVCVEAQAGELTCGTDAVFLQ